MARQKWNEEPENEGIDESYCEGYDSGWQEGWARRALPGFQRP